MTYIEDLEFAWIRSTRSRFDSSIRLFASLAHRCAMAIPRLAVSRSLFQKLCCQRLQFRAPAVRKSCRLPSVVRIIPQAIVAMPIIDPAGMIQDRDRGKCRATGTPRRIAASVSWQT